MPMAAVMTHHEIVFGEHRAGTGSHGLLTDIAVGRPFDQALLEHVDHAFVEAADPEHGSVYGLEILIFHSGSPPVDLWSADRRSAA